MAGALSVGGGVKIGRGSCRERGEISGVAGSLKKKKKNNRNGCEKLRAVAVDRAIVSQVSEHSSTSPALHDTAPHSRTPLSRSFFFFFQAEDGIRDYRVTGVQTCALPISSRAPGPGGQAAFWFRISM